MSDIKELKDDELKSVVGGSTEENAPTTFDCGKWAFTNHVSKYAEAHIGEMLYLVDHDGNNYYYGTLSDSYEAESTFWTERMQDMTCIEHNGIPFTGFIEVSGDDYYLYRTRTK